MATKHEAKIYTHDGTASGTIALPEVVFDVAWNGDLVHGVVIAMQGNARNNTVHTKDRGEVRGGGKKPWRQKGTGRARHGSRRSPLWAGGGTTFGPRNERSFERKINKKVRAKALGAVLSRKFRDGEIIFLQDLAFSAPKTKEAQTVLQSLSKAEDTYGELATKSKNAALIALSARAPEVEKSFRNIQGVDVAQVKDINPVDVLTYKYVVFVRPEDALGILEGRIAHASTAKAQVPA